ncbi:hypothetical protein GFS24_18165 [Chitinophaga sp. SYP-B3965]|uniref:hypothetical protein n=1 Tax=Chitinophaga sp. SYP-B3965 TaxID=2663120 RepID=UPI001299ABE5|nr:hypothetical protein [Chitinophaga sp. SYP-B3965]MRG47054.1 hypothetical protein [Chitinophaga sp. SYP-B3965]
MRKTLLGLTAMTLFFAACNKDDNDDTTPGTYYLSKFIQVGEDGNDTTLISYNENNTFKETYSSGMNNGQLEFYEAGPVYEGGKIIAVQQRSSLNPVSHYTKSFVYTGDLVTKVNYYWDNNQDGQYEVGPAFDSLVYVAGKLTELWALNPDQPDNQNKYLLTWEGNNVKTCSLYFKHSGNDFILESVNKYTYDNKPGYQHLIGSYLWLDDLTSFEYLSANNVTKEEYFNNNDVLGSTYTHAYTYEGNLLKTIDTEEAFTDPVRSETYKIKFEYITK